VKKFKIKSKIFLWYGDKASWHFLGIPKNEARQIKDKFGKKRRGFGSIPVQVTLGKTSWRTSIFPDSKTETYILPLKLSVRRAEGLYDGDEVIFLLKII